LITLVDGASSRPQFIELLGTAMIIKLSRDSLDFGYQRGKTQSQPQVVTAINESDTPLMFTSVRIADEVDFSVTENCTGHVIQPGAICAASVVFHPKKIGMTKTELLFNLPMVSIGPPPVVVSGVGTPP